MLLMKHVVLITIMLSLCCVLLIYLSRQDMTWSLKGKLNFKMIKLYLLHDSIQSIFLWAHYFYRLIMNILILKFRDHSVLHFCFVFSKVMIFCWVVKDAKINNLLSHCYNQWKLRFFALLYTKFYAKKQVQVNNIITK